MDSRDKAGIAVRTIYDEKGRVIAEYSLRDGVTCPECRGSGTVQLLTTIRTCSVCSGRGKLGGSDVQNNYYYPEDGTGAKK